jgi:hypothetical protein
VYLKRLSQGQAFKGKREEDFMSYLETILLDQSKVEWTELGSCPNKVTYFVMVAVAFVHSDSQTDRVFCDNIGLPRKRTLHSQTLALCIYVFYGFNISISKSNLNLRT